MTNPIESDMTCEQLADVLPDFLEREVDEPVRARVEAHALACTECGALVADLRKLRVDAANLPVRAPSRDLWAGIAARIETPVVEIVPGGGTVERWSGAPLHRARRRLLPLWAGLAAASLVAITASITYQIAKSTIAVPAPMTITAGPSPAPSLARSTVPPSIGTAAPVQQQRSAVPPSMSLASRRPSAEETYDMEIKRLRVIVAARRSSLDTLTIAVIEKNLKVIDGAIAQCRAALQGDPASRFLLESLNDALSTKVQLLRTAATLPSRS